MLTLVSITLLMTRVGHAVALEEPQDLHPLRQLDQEFLIPLQMMDVKRVAGRERAHRLDVLPIGNRDELGLVLEILAKGLHAQRRLDERLDADFVVVGLVLVGAIASGAPAPDPGNCRLSQAMFLLNGPRSPLS